VLGAVIVRAGASALAGARAWRQVRVDHRRVGVAAASDA
jgi:hypothetical protein